MPSRNNKMLLLPNGFNDFFSELQLAGHAERRQLAEEVCGFLRYTKVGWRQKHNLSQAIENADGNYDFLKHQYTCGQFRAALSSIQRDPSSILGRMPAVQQTVQRIVGDVDLDASWDGENPSDYESDA